MIALFGGPRAGAQASGAFGQTATVANYTNVAAARMNAMHNLVVTDQTSSTQFPFYAETLTGSAYVGTKTTSLTVNNFNGASIDDASDLSYCYYNSGDIRINTRIFNGGTSYTPTYNIYVTGATSSVCAGDGKGTIYLAAGNGSLQTAVPVGSTFTMTTVSGTPAGISNVVLGYDGNLLVSATGGTYVGTISSTGAWTGTLVTTRTFYRSAAYQDSTGIIYLEDATTQAGYQYSLSGGTYTQSSWTKPFGVTAVAYSYNTAGSLMVASATAVNIQYSSALTFPAIALGTADPAEELVLKITAAGTLGSVKVAGSGGATDFTDAGTGTCTTNGSSHTYAIGDLCTVDVLFNPVRGGARTGTVTVQDASGSALATAALTGTGIGSTVDHLSFTTLPTSTTPSASFAAAVTAYSDAAGTTVATFVNGTAATVTSSDTAAMLPSNVTFANGVATFNVTLNTQGSETITVTDPVDSKTVTSSNITVGPSVNHLTLTSLPTSATAGTAISGTVTAYSNSGTTVATTYTGPVKITSSDTNAGLPSNLTLSNGTASFSVTLKTMPSQTITAADTSGTPTVTSGSITVNASAAATINAATGSGQSAIIGNAFTNPLVVQTVDAYSNPVGGVTVSFATPGSGASATFSLTSCTTSATATPAGSCSVTATANATVGSNYSVMASAAGLTSGTFTLSNSAKTAQTITFAQPGAQTFGATPTLTASSTSGLIVAFSSTTTSVCMVTSGGALTFLTAGTCGINADQAGNSTYAAATTVSRSFTVNALAPGAPIIGTATAANQQATVSFMAPANTGGAAITAYTVTSSPGGKTGTGSTSPITVTGLTNGASYTFTVTAANSAGTGTASASSNSVVPSGAQTITFNNPGTQTFGTTPTLTATASSGLAVSFSSTTTGVCTVTGGGTLTFVATGTCSIHADQAGNSTYNAAATVTQGFTVQAASQTITFAQPASPVTFGASPITLTATGGVSGNAVTFSVISGPGTVSGSTLTVTGAGTIVVAADQAGNSNYSAATEVQRSVMVNAAAQTITFTQPATPVTYGVSPITLAATGGGSGNAVTFSVISGPGTVTASTLTVTGAGTIIVAADEAGNTNYSAATQVQRTIIVNPASQTIAFTQPSTPIPYGSSTTVALSATGGTSGNAVTFTVASGPGTISGSTLTITGAGTIVISANQAASTNYAAATQVQRSLVVGTAASTLTGPATQPVFVVFGQSGTVPVTIAAQYSGAGIAAPGSGTAGNAISYSIVNSSSTSVASGSLTITSGAVSVPVASTLAPGLYTVNASYAGDSNYSAAAPITINLQVGQIQPVATITAPLSALTYGSTLGIAATATYRGSAVAGSFTYTATPTGGTASAVTAATILPAGSYLLTANFTPTDAITYKTATTTAPLTVNKATPGVSLTSSVNPLLMQNATTLTATVSSAVSTPGGSVTFYDNTASAAIGASIPLTNGVATANVSTLTVGTHSITAIYSGDTNFVTFTSAAVSEQVDDFSLAISTSAGSSTSQTVVPGGTATYNFTLSPTGATTFPAAVNLTVTGLPTGATYTITASTLAAGSGSTPVTLTITAPKQTAMLHTSEKLAPFALALLLLPFGGHIRRSAGKLPGLAALLLLLAGGVASMAALTGCGSSTGFFASPQQTYNVTITGTSGALTHSTTVTLTVE